MDMQPVIKFIVVAMAVVPAIVLHEVAHGWVANAFGDRTAKMAGRLSLNPLKHVDPLGTIILPVVLYLTMGVAFGYAKPVPVNVSRLRKPREQGLWVSLAGPGTNFALLGVAIAIGRSPLCDWSVYAGDSFSLRNWIAVWALYFGLVNVTLGLFNLLPLPPLDGSAIIERFVPVRRLSNYYQLRAKALPYAMALLILNSLYLHLGTGVMQNVQDTIGRLVSGA